MKNKMEITYNKKAGFPDEFALDCFHESCPSARYVGGTSKYLCECKNPHECEGVKRTQRAYEAHEAMVTPKKYKCKRCGHEKTETGANHYGNTYSFGHFNTCPNCPPWAKYPEFGGSTEWECLTLDKKEEE